VYGLVSQQDVSSEVGPCVVHGSAAAEMDEALYLLLDLRDEVDYEDCHIATAICYPHTQVTPAARRPTLCALEPPGEDDSMGGAALSRTEALASLAVPPTLRH